MEANQILQSNILDILFDGKNKSYGAYDLRKTYNKRISAALTTTFVVIALFFIGALIADKLKDNKTIIPIVSAGRTLKNIPPDKPKPLPPPKLPPHAQMATIKVATPRVVNDELVIEPPPDVKQIESAKIDLKNLEGTKDPGIIAPPEEIKGTNVLSAPVEKKSKEDSVFIRVEIEASFPGGPKAWQRYVQKAITAQMDEFEDADYGTCLVKFIVDKNGNVSNVEATNMKGSKLAEIAVNTIRKGPRWTPAIQNGRYVNAYRTQPVTLQNPNQ